MNNDFLIRLFVEKLVPFLIESGLAKSANRKAEEGNLLAYVVGLKMNNMSYLHI